LQAPDADQADASLHILAVLYCEDPPICSRPISSGILDVVVAFPAEEALIAILAESHQALLDLSDSEDAALSIMAVQMFDVLAITEN
jgi:hypothetical protein